MNPPHARRRQRTSMNQAELLPFEQAPTRPRLREIIARNGLPLTMLAILGLTVVWGGFVTCVLAVCLWKLAGVLL